MPRTKRYEDGVRRSIQLERAQWDELAELSTATGIDASQIISLVLNHHLETVKGVLLPKEELWSRS
ncbi:MAG: hypothetical protein AAFX93_19610 [Verrucomicrobiota bacterium]